MGYIYLLLGAGAIFGFLYWQNASLKDDLETALMANTELKIANDAYRENIANANEELTQKLESLKALENSKKEVVRYVTQTKTKIIKDNNSTCIAELNAVFKQLLEQNSNSTNTSADKNASQK